MSENETTITRCSHCGNELRILSSYEPGGVNDYGGVIVDCFACSTMNDVYIGRDYTTARVIAGGRHVGAYDRDVDGDRNLTRKRHGLPPAVAQH